MPEPAEKAPQAQSGATPGVFIDPYRSYNFKLIILGVTEGHFTQCSGLGMKVDAIAYREGGTTQVIHRLPGRVDYAPVTLQYGVTESRELWDWMMSAVKGSVQRQTVQIVMLDADGVTERLRYTLQHAWPSEWRAAPLDAMSSLVAIESLELVYETVDRD
jgi:phage tail-like protein